MRRVVFLIVLAGIVLGGLQGCSDKQGGVTKTEPNPLKDRVPPPPNKPK